MIKPRKVSKKAVIDVVAARKVKNDGRRAISGEIKAFVWLMKVDKVEGSMRRPYCRLRTKILVAMPT